jgi:allantoicase
MTDFTQLPVLSDERLGAAVVDRNDEFFALADNLLRPDPPEHHPDRYTKRGKWMDGWETRRRRDRPGADDGWHDWCVIRLGAPGLVNGVVVDTAHFTGNFPAECWLEGCSLEGYPTREELAAASWETLTPHVTLSGDHKHMVPVHSRHRITYVRLNIAPDGGIARLQVHGEPVPAPRELAGLPLDLAGIEYGGIVTDCSDMYYSHRHNLNLPSTPASMADGWETRRRRGPGNDWVVLRLAAEGHVRIAEVDTRWFKGNAPMACSLDLRGDGDWQPLMERTPLQPHTRHRFPVQGAPAATHVRLNIFPDGGIARLRLYGELSDAGAAEVALRWLNTLTAEAALQQLLAVCGSQRWAAEMAARRPFITLDEVHGAARDVWRGLSETDWEEAFAAHPRIGERRGSAWSREEQAGTSGAGEELEAALVSGNEQYEQRFGRVFLVNASGLGAQDVLDRLNDRIGASPDDELATAAAEQEAISALRLDKLLRP